MLRIRPFTRDDASALLDLYRDTIRRVNCRDYNPEQIAAWASGEIDIDRWTERFEGRFVVVAECDGAPAGFSELESDGHIDRFYVSADHQRQGVGRALITALIDEARRRGVTRLFSEVSLTARPFFESQGFAVMASQTVVARGVEFLNYRMERDLRLLVP